MRLFAALLMMIYTEAATPEAGSLSSEWWQYWMLGRPCSTETDRIEGTCYLEVNQTPDWSE